MCSASLTAIHEACEHLLRKECELAFAGGVNLYLHPTSYAALCALRVLSPDGKCRSFGSAGNGIAPGEGVGVVLLKPLARAIADRDRIYAVIRSTSINHGGRTNGYTVPNPAAQRELVLAALRKSGIHPRTISYVEAHGTGTELGDPIEIAGLTQAFRQETQDTQFCAIGSTKSNIGHCESAAGIAGLTKIVLQMQHGEIAPSLHAEELNPHIDWATTPFVVQRQGREWTRPVVAIDGASRTYPRIAAISSFGAGGANAHLIVEEYIEPLDASPQVATVDEHPAIVLLSAKSAQSLREQVRRLLDALEQRRLQEQDLRNIAYTLQIGREAFEHRLALVVDSLPALKEVLQRYLAGEQAIANLHQGEVRKSPETAGLFAQDEDMQVAIEAWVAKGKYGKLLDLWVQGLTYDWNRLYTGTTAKRMSLPTYAFAQDKYWIDSPQTLDLPALEDEPPAHHVLLAAPDVAADSERVRERVLYRLKALFSEVTKLKIAQIDGNQPLERYAIDSIVVTQMNHRLAKVFGELSKTLLYEYPTLGQICDFLLAEHRPACLRWAGVEAQLPKPPAGDSVIRRKGIALAPQIKPLRSMHRSTESRRGQEPIAIIGIAGRYPQAANLNEFWMNLQSGRDCVTETPADRWPLEGFYHPDPDEAVAQGKSYCKWGGFIDGFAEFDPLFFSMTPGQVLEMDPQERLFLQTTWEVLENAGYTRELIAKRHNGRGGVFVGITKTGFDLHGPELWARGQSVFPYTSFGSVANRVSYLLNLHGPSFPIDTMCSSSLTAIHEACEHLLRSECEIAVAGGGESLSASGNVSCDVPTKDALARRQVQELRTKWQWLRSRRGRWRGAAQAS